MIDVEPPPDGAHKIVMEHIEVVVDRYLDAGLTHSVLARILTIAALILWDAEPGWRFETALARARRQPPAEGASDAVG